MLDEWIDPRKRFILKRYLFYKHEIRTIVISIKRIYEKENLPFFPIQPDLIGWN